MDFGLVQRRRADRDKLAAETSRSRRAGRDQRREIADDERRAQHATSSRPVARRRAPAPDTPSPSRTRRTRDVAPSSPAPGAMLGTPGVHVARAVPRRADRRAHRPVQLLRRAVRGAVRRAPVRGPHARRADPERRRRDGAPRAAGLARCPRWMREALLRGLRGRSERALAVDERAARRAGASGPRSRAAAASPRPRPPSWPASGRRPSASDRSRRR